MRGYKVFNPDWTCRDFQYKVGITYEMDEKPVCWEKGFHFCEKLVDCFDYYPAVSINKVAEIEALGEIDKKGSSVCTNKIKIVRELSWEEVLSLVNTREGNSGVGNNGKYNSGNHNDGNSNSGYHNNGDSNSGNHNSGDFNSGWHNTGNHNTGDWNTGDSNSGDWNTGDWNAGECNTGGRNSGSYNEGSGNAGDYNSGSHNSGNYNRGGYNSGNWNAGSYNSGSYNIGWLNSGYYNIGDWNTGDWNKTNSSNGCFNTEEQTILMFNKPSNWTLKDWRDSAARFILNEIQYNGVEWIPSYNMTDEEKEEQYPNYKTANGYLKKLKDFKEHQTWWDNLDSDRKKIILSLPNFDADIFKEITGIDVNK